MRKLTFQAEIIARRHESKGQYLLVHYSNLIEVDIARIENASVRVIKKNEVTEYIEWHLGLKQLVSVIIYLIRLRKTFQSFKDNTQYNRCLGYLLSADAN